MIARIFLEVVRGQGPRALFQCVQTAASRKQARSLRAALYIRARERAHNIKVRDIKNNCWPVIRWLLGKRAEDAAALPTLQFTLAAPALGQNSQPVAWLPSSFAHSEMN